MIEIRIHGRGGQGAVVASLILARAAHHQGWEVQVFPEFGVERRGAPVTAFARLDRQPIYLRSKVYEPDHVIVFDPGLKESIDVTAGLKDNGWILVNTSSPPEAIRNLERFRPATIDATGIAAKYKIGTATAPIVNTTMVGAFAGVSGLFSMESVAAGIRETIQGPAAALNIAAASEAYQVCAGPSRPPVEAETGIRQ